MKENLPETLYVYMEDIGVGDGGEDEYSAIAFTDINDICESDRGDEDTEIGVYELKSVGFLERAVKFVASKKRK